MNFNKTVTAQDNLIFTVNQIKQHVKELKNAINGLNFDDSKMPVIYIENLYINENNSDDANTAFIPSIHSENDVKNINAESDKKCVICTEKSSANPLSDVKLYENPAQNQNSELEEFALKRYFNLGAKCHLKPSESLVNVADFDLAANEILKALADPSNGYLQYRRNYSKKTNGSYYLLTVIFDYAFKQAEKCGELIGNKKKSRFVRYVIERKLNLNLTDYMYSYTSNTIKPGLFNELSEAARNYLDKHNLSY